MRKTLSGACETAGRRVAITFTMFTGRGTRLERGAIDSWNSTVMRPWLAPASRRNSPLIQRRAAPMPRESLVVSERVWRVLNPTRRSMVARRVSAEISETIRSTVGFRPGCCPGGSPRGSVRAKEVENVRVKRTAVLDRIIDVAGAAHAPPATRGWLKNESGFLGKSLLVVRFVLVDDLFRPECVDGSAPACRGEDLVPCIVCEKLDRILCHALNIPDFGDVAGLAMDDELGKPADARSDDRQFAGHRLKRGESETLGLAGNEKQV